MDYRESREYINSISKYGSVLGLESITELLKRLGNPQDTLKVIHFAGTNGKGSTIAYTESILLQAQYKVGKYTSPAVFDYMEMFKINGDNIGEDEYAIHMTYIKEAADDMVKSGTPHPTPFEVETALAFLCFKENDCDVVLLETGMGGKTDATNVMKNVLCSVITSVSMDHMQFLGNTLSEIATVKAGIIKEKCPVVLYRQSEEVMEIVHKICDKKNAQLVITNRPDNIHMDENGYAIFDYECADFEDSCNNKKHIFSGVRTIMSGTYQPYNVAVAIEIAMILKNQGFEVGKYIMAGIENAKLEGRFEKINSNPIFIIDGAHNPGAAEELKRSIEMYFTNKKITFIMGVLADKDYDRVAQITAPLAENVITVTPDNQRALDAVKLKDTVEKYNPNVYAAESIKEAVSLSADRVKNGQADVIIAYGSLSYLGKIKELVKQIF